MKHNPISRAIAEAFGLRIPRHGMSAMTYLLAGGPFLSVKL